MNKRNAPWMSALAMLLGITLHAGDIAGDWQATLKTGLQDLRVVLVIDKSADGKWNSTFGSIDQSPAGPPALLLTQSVCKAQI
jgi:hypothetical protein